MHPYWVVAQVAKLEFTINDAGVASTSRGLVGDTVFAILPNVKPIYTFIVTIAFQSVRANYILGKPQSTE